MEPHAFENSGAHSSPADSRDFKDHEVREALAGSALPIHNVTNIPDVSAVPVLYQGQQSSCVPHSRTWAFHYKYWLENKILLNLSPRFGYALDKSVDGVPNVLGTYPRVDLAEFQKKGECDNTLFPNDITLSTQDYQDISMIPSTAGVEALKYSNVQYINVACDADSIKAAIDDWQVVMACVHIGAEWWTSPSGVISWAASDILPVRPPATNVSGHQIAIYGYDENTFYFANSFGAAWGNNGYGTMTINQYMPYFMECWAIQELPQDVVQNLKAVVEIQNNLPITPPTPVTPNAPITPPGIRTGIAWLDKLIAWLSGGPTPS